MEIGKRFGCDDRNVLTQENARDRERAFAQGLGRSLVVTLPLMMGSMIVVARMGRVGSRRRHACAEHDRQAGRIGREHEARRHEHAREQQRQQPQSPAMEMQTLHAGTKYTSLRRANPWLLWAMVAKKSGLSPERGHKDGRTRRNVSDGAALARFVINHPIARPASHMETRCARRFNSLTSKR